MAVSVCCHATARRKSPSNALASTKMILTSLAQQTQSFDGIELLWNLHQSHEGKAGLCLTVHGHQGVIIDELKVVELPVRQFVVERLHHVPRPITDSNHDDAQRVLGCPFDGSDGRLFIGHLSIGNDKQNVELHVLGTDLHGLVNDGGKAGRAGQTHCGSDLCVAMQHIFQSLARSGVRHEWKHAPVFSSCVAKAEHRNEIVLIKC
mmetsp:Transcript_72993/g.122965  ORF Transcript_72993/g.122965 Transcript_72993/m.122965 type:complete len:206 (-) Transcript_72993:379-996(-)